MQEILNSKERSLLKYFYSRYKKDFTVRFRISIYDCPYTVAKNSEQLYNILFALYIRKYITFDIDAERTEDCSEVITLTEKALNVFNLKSE